MAVDTVSSTVSKSGTFMGGMRSVFRHLSMAVHRMKKKKKKITYPLSSAMSFCSPELMDQVAPDVVKDGVVYGKQGFGCMGLHFTFRLLLLK